MKLAERINKPEYLYRPRQALQRIAQTLRPQPKTFQAVLPWGLRMWVRPSEDLGSALWRFGIYDLPLSETIWRLLDPGETAIDVGANIGYVTGLMAGAASVAKCSHSSRIPGSLPNLFRTFLPGASTGFRR